MRLARLLLPLLALLACGCVSDRHVVLTPAEGPLAVEAAALKAPPFAIHVSDARVEPAVVGEVRGLWRMRVARVESVVDVAEWVRVALTRALAARGAEVLPPADERAQASPPQALLEAEIERAFCGNVRGYHAEVRLHVVAHVDGRAVLGTTVVGEAEAPPGPDEKGEVQADCLERALAAAADGVASRLVAGIGAGAGS